ncbi:MAG: amidohydrolase family protein [Rhodospirillales bacterium]|nr:amidohydrolase family protein [Rhodospirillales bacterium]
MSLEDGLIKDILTSELPSEVNVEDDLIEHAAFIMPGLVEAHCHLFLDGGELDFKQRSEYLKADEDEMLAVARRNIAASLVTGITFIRDAGDKWGINHRIREELAASDELVPEVRSPGLGIRKPKRYGGFMAREVETKDEILAAIKDLLKTGDELKILLTGIIDFETGTVKGEPQFDVDEAKLIVATAHDLGYRTFAHCSGLAGLEVAAAAGVDSVEHGFFITRDILEILAEKQIAWVPTFSPVHFQWTRPEIVGWSDESVDNLRRILDSHSEHIKLADEMGVPVVVGSDAGSHGVVHGEAVIDEIKFLVDAGMSMAKALNATTALPRRLWGSPSADIKPGNKVEIIGLPESPFENMAASWQLSWIMVGNDQITL